MKITFLFKAFLLLSLFTSFKVLAWECDVTVSGPDTVKLNQQITLSAFGTPAGGSYSWSRTPYLTPNGATATLTGFQPTYSEYIRVISYYTSPKGKKCSDTKWLWACVCTISNLNGPTEAKINEQVSLTAQADPAGGIYTWTINSGTGTLLPNNSSAEFIGDKAGPVEIKVSYVPPEGGEPCEQYHTIQLSSDCKVTLTGYELQRPVCRSADFTAQGIPAGGTCKWTAGNGISSNNCNAIYTAQTIGNDTVTVTYTTPGGTNCDASKTVLSYSLDGMESMKKCFESGTVLRHSDFDFSISPASFSFRPTLSPETVTTNQSQAQILITANPVCDSGMSNEVSTVIDVVNKDKTLSAEIEVEIPDVVRKPLKFLGLVDQLNFNVKNTYDKITECCEAGPGNSIKGTTSVNAEADLKDFTVYGVPLPKKAKEFVSFNALQVDLKSKSGLLISGKSQACENSVTWDGGGELKVELGAGSKAKVKAPYVLLQGEVKGTTDIKETLTVGSSQVTVNGQWGGLVIKGIVKILLLDWKIKPIEISHQIFEGDETPVLTVDLPSLN